MKIYTFYVVNLCLSFAAYSIQAQSPFIHVDQFGYTPNASKVAVLSDPVVGQNSTLSYTPDDSLELRRWLDNSLVGKFEAEIWNSGQVHNNYSGDRGWWVDFSGVDELGTFYLTDASTLDTSAIFKIDYNCYDEALTAACRMFYYNRCNMAKETPYAEPNWVDPTNNFVGPLQDANCRYIFDPNNATIEKDLSGGWFDAGDYNKYVTFTMEALHNLLWAYRSNPNAFGDDNNIPESNNGIPDILDEIKWELDWLFKMCNADGSVHIKMGSQNYNENVSSPPSNNFDQRFYGPTCTSASLTIASVMSHAATVFSTINGMQTYADQLLAQAENCWDYVLPYYNTGTLEYNCDNGEIVAGDADFDANAYQEGMIAAAIYLFEASGDVSYNTFVENNYLNSMVFGAQANVPGTPSTYYDDWWDMNYMETKDAYLNYVNINGHVPQVANDFADSFQAMINNNWEAFYGMNPIDLYRAYMPSYYLGWSSNQQQSNMATLNLNVVNYGYDNSLPDSYIQKAAAHLHFIHGVNPLGVLYLSNMYGKGGERCVDEIYHTWFADGTDYDNAITSLYGPAPGFMPGGPNHTYTGTRTPPSGEPYLKAFDHFNDVANISWEITEPAIYAQAAYIRILVSMMAEDESTTVPNLNLSQSEITIFPNPTNQFFILKGNLIDFDIKILDANGSVVQTINTTASEYQIDTTPLGPGIYFVRTESKTNNILSVQKIIKM